MSRESERPRILVLVPIPPRLDGFNGGSRAVARLVLAIPEDFTVAVLYLRGADERRIDESVSARCALVEEVPRVYAGGPTGRYAGWLAAWLAKRPMWVRDWDIPAFRDRLARLVETWRPDVVEIHFHVLGQMLSVLEGCHASGGRPIRKILVHHEPGAAAAWHRYHQAPWWLRFARYRDARAWETYERAILPRFEVVSVFTKEDAEALRMLSPDARVTVIPLPVAARARPLNPLGHSPESVMFFGNFSHPPNLDAALRLAREIFPLIRRRNPGALLMLVGDAPPPVLRRLASDTIRVTGRVPAVEVYLDAAAVVTAPLRLGGGVRVKVQETLAAGKALVASALALRGIDAQPGSDVLLAESNQQFAEAIGSLLDDPQLRATIAANAHRWSLTADRAARVAASRFNPMSS